LVTKEILKEGAGEETPPEGSKVKVNYIGTLLEGGKEFDRSSKPFEFKIGQGTVIKGWDVGVPTMK